jgi:hypothetical protein
LPLKTSCWLAVLRRLLLLILWLLVAVVRREIEMVVVEQEVYFRVLG